MNGPTPHGWLCVVLHDVAPVHWAACTRVLRVLRTLERDAGVTLPLTLLVAPQLDGVHFAQRYYLSGLHRLQLEGHELALQGLSNGVPVTARSRFIEHLQHRPDDRGEFAALDRNQARARLMLGRAWAHRQQLTMHGFVAPDWRLSEGTWQAASDAGFDYTCTRSAIVALPGGQALSAPSLVFSTRSAWQRGLSVLWNQALAWQHSDEPLLRLELHPRDADHPEVLRCWTGLLATALRERRPLRLAQSAQRARARAPTPSLAQLKA